MNEVPQMASISELRNNHLAVFQRLGNGPVILASRAEPQAVVVSVPDWNRIVEQMNRVEELEDIAEALEDMLRVERGELELEEVDISELEAWADRVPA